MSTEQLLYTAEILDSIRCAVSKFPSHETPTIAMSCEIYGQIVNTPGVLVYEHKGGVNVKLFGCPIRWFGHDGPWWMVGYFTDMNEYRKKVQG